MNNVYQIIDTKTGAQVGTDHANKVRARNKAEKLNQQYGAHRYVVKIIWGDA